MTLLRPRWIAAAAVGFLVGCGNGDASDTSEGGDTGEVDPAIVIEADPSGAIVFSDRSNYTFTGALDGPSFPLRALADVGLDWSGLSHDLQCHDVDPVADIDNVALLWFKDLTEADVEEGLSTDTLQQVNLSAYVAYEPGDATTVTLSQLLAFGATDPEIETFFEAGSGAWLVLLTTGTTIGVGARTLAFLDPQDGATATMGSLTGGCEVLDWTVDLEALDPIGVLSGGPWLLDFSGLTTTGQGGPFDATKVTEVMLAHYDDMELPELEENFLDIELIADGIWTYEMESGATVDLAAMADADGAAFPGFTAGGSWILALRCVGCPSPAPLALTVLVPQ